MRVEVRSQNANSQLHLVGTALGAARVGERVAFRVRLNGAVRHGVVRGPATVELIPARIER
ncbi:MAG TPA: hypothetical protein VHX37_03705 [Acidobacteriaceae bacterium]|jgi:hypothetical protein|nr:hypothetical protein [Acidobacteriaceae bacterium]